MITSGFRNIFYSSLMMLLVCGLAVKSQGAVETSTYSLSESLKKSHFDLYSESTYYQEYNVVTDTRLRYYSPWSESENFKLSSYVGADFQYQTPNAPSKYFDNTFNSSLGLQLQMFRNFFLQAQAGTRTVIADQSTTPTTDKSTQWDPRIILSAGNFWSWVIGNKDAPFTEAYGESVYVPRISSTPVSTGWLKQGYRWTVVPKIFLDGYGEFYGRESRSDDLGPSMTEWRLGTRAQWIFGSWSIAGLLYHNFDKAETSGPLEGLLVVGGIF